MALILSILLNLFQKININNYFLSQETMDKSLFYNPIQKTSQLIFPSVQEWYEDFKTIDADKETSSAS
jgi:membrane protein required for colicin V production